MTALWTLPSDHTCDGVAAFTFAELSLWVSYDGTWYQFQGGAGTVTSISQGTGIVCTPNPITGTGTVALAVPVALVNGGTHADLSAAGPGYLTQASNGANVSDLTGTNKLAAFNGTGVPTAVTPGVGISISSGVPSLAATIPQAEEIQVTTAATNSTSIVLTLSCLSLGTPAAGFGLQQFYALADSTSAEENAADWTVTWATATHASRKGRIVGNAWDTSAREWIRGEANGLAAMIGFLGASATAAQASPDIGSDYVTRGLATGTCTFAAANLTGQVSASHGGTGIDTHSSTGVPSISSGTWSVGAHLTQSLGGTGLDTSGVTDGQVLIGQTSDHSFGLATLTAGTNITITNAGHSVTITAAGGGSGSVTSVAGGKGTDGTTVTTTGTINASNACCGGRLTLTSNTPVTTSDVTSGSTLYWTPYNGDTAPNYNGTSMLAVTFAQLSLSLSGMTSGKNYDVYFYVKSGTAKIDLGPAWTAGAVAGSNTARGTGAGSTELIQQNGVWVNKNAVTTLVNSDSLPAYNGSVTTTTVGTYLGTIRAISATATADCGLQAAGTPNQRFVWNFWNRKQRPMQALESTGSWFQGSSSAWEQANSSSTNKVEYVCGMAEDPTTCEVFAQNVIGAGAANGSVGVGVDSTTVNSATTMAGYVASSVQINTTAFYKGFPGLGYHYIAWIERSDSTSTIWLGKQASPPTIQSGMAAIVWG